MANFEELVQQHDVRTQLHKDLMIDHGGDLDWLRDPSIIPGRIVDYNQPHIDDPFINASRWMTDRLADWCLRTNVRLDYAKIFDEHDLDGELRVAVRTMMNEQAKIAFEPGVTAMAEFFAAVPKVAVRDGIDDPNEWTNMASKARKFGVLMARDGTFVQGLVRTYLAGEVSINGNFVLDEDKLVTDANTGITSITPISTLVNLSDEAIKATRPGMQEAIGGACPAIYAPVKALNDKRMYDAVWDAFTVFADTNIYPTIKVDPDELLPPVYPSLEEVKSDIDYIAEQDIHEVQVPMVDLTRLSLDAAIRSILDF